MIFSRFTGFLYIGESLLKTCKKGVKTEFYAFTS
nr:MAG TPA: hypothetical protein [Caudoviricetes sp.]